MNQCKTDKDGGSGAAPKPLLEKADHRGGWRNYDNGGHPWRNPLYKGGWKIRDEETRKQRRKEESGRKAA